MKTCNECGLTKPLNEFTINGSRKGTKTYRGKCKPCYRKHYKETATPETLAKRKAARKIIDERRQADDPFIWRKKNWKQQGIDIAEAEKVCLSNDGSCDICGDRPSKSLHLDHCHTTNIVRGMLCDSCNHMLGKARDSQRILIAAIDYLNNRN